MKKTIYKRFVVGGIVVAIFTGGSLVSPSTLSYAQTASVTSSTTNIDNKIEKEARQAVIHFFTAQKSGDVEQMIKYSTHAQDIINLKDFYKKFCQEHPLLHASITDATVINDSLVIVSTEMRLKDQIVISTTPVYKENNQWKMVRGLSPQNYTETNPSQKINPLEKEAQQAVKNYFKAVESGNVDELLRYLYIVPPYSQEQVKQHYIRLSENPPTNTNLKQLTVVGEKLALVKVEHEFNPYKISTMIPMLKDSNHWKIVFGHRLTIDSIPVGAHIQKIK